MANEIKRKVELWLCGTLAAAVQSVRFFPTHGGSESDDAAEIEPPYCEVAVDGAPEKVLAQESTWTVRVALGYLSHIDETDTPAHSATVRAIYEALGTLGRGYQAAQQLVVHGIDIESTDTFSDDQSQIHGDVFNLVLGVSG